jgi:hypothetical protein
MKFATYSKILKRHNLTLADVAEMFGSKSEHSFRSSTAFKQRIKGVCDLIEHVEDNIVKKIKG